MLPQPLNAWGGLTRKTTDDELHARIIAPLPAGVKLHAWVDACHSGSILDLPYQISPEQRSSRAPGGLGPWLQASDAAAAVECVDGD